MEGTEKFFSLDPSIRKEYAGGRPVVIVPADIVFENRMVLDPGGVSVCLTTCISPHTDDTTLVYVCEDKTLFLGDSTCEEFRTGKKDRALCGKLSDTIRGINPEICLEGHWVSTDTEDSQSALMGRE